MVDFLDTRLDQLDFGPGYTVRLRGLFERGRFEAYTQYEQAVPTPLVTVRDLVALSEAQVLRQPNIDKKSLGKLREMLMQHGLHFGITAPLRCGSEDLVFVLLSEGELRNNTEEGIIHLVVERIREARQQIEKLDRQKIGAQEAKDSGRRRA